MHTPGFSTSPGDGASHRGGVGAWRPLCGPEPVFTALSPVAALQTWDTRAEVRQVQVCNPRRGSGSGGGACGPCPSVLGSVRDSAEPGSELPVAWRGPGWPGQLWDSTGVQPQTLSPLQSRTEDAVQRPGWLQGLLVTGLPKAGGKGWGRVRRCHGDGFRCFPQQLPNKTPGFIFSPGKGRALTHKHALVLQARGREARAAQISPHEAPRGPCPCVYAGRAGLCPHFADEGHEAHAGQIRSCQGSESSLLFPSSGHPRTDPDRSSRAKGGLFQVSEGGPVPPGPVGNTLGEACPVPSPTRPRSRARPRLGPQRPEVGSHKAYARGSLEGFFGEGRMSRGS